MEVADRIRSARRGLLVAVLPLAALLVWTAGGEAFQLPKATLVAVVACLCLASYLAESSWSRRLALPRTWFLAALGVFLVTLVAATVTSGDRTISIVGWHFTYSGLVGYASLVVLAGVALREVDDDLVVRLVQGLVLTVLATSAYGLLQLADLDPVGWQLGAWRVFSTLGNANFFAGYLGVAVPVVFGAALSPMLDARWRWAAAVAAVMGAVTSAATLSYQGPIAVAAGCTAVLALRLLGGTGPAVPVRSMWARPWVKASAVLSALALLAALPLALRLMARGVESGLRPRRDYWGVAWRLFRRDPVFGSGLDTYAQHYFALRPPWSARGGFELADAPHNVPLSMLSNGGVVLAAAYAAVVIVTGLALIRGVRSGSPQQRRVLAALGGGWIGYQLQSVVSIDVYPLAALHWVLSGAIVALGSRPALLELDLPGRADLVRQAARSPRRGRATAGRSVPITSWVASAAVAVALAGALVQVTRPLRADLADRGAFEQLKRGDDDAALSRSDRAIALAPWRAIYHQGNAFILERMGRLPEARQAMERAARLEPGTGGYALLSGRLARKANDLRSARAWFLTAARRDPQNPYLLQDVGTELTLMGEAASGRRLLRRAVDRVNEVPSMWLALGRAEAALGDLEAAEAAFRRSIALQGGYGDASEPLEQLLAAKAARKRQAPAATTPP